LTDGQTGMPWEIGPPSKIAACCSPMSFN
jgi:hypothetical protein